MTLHQEITEIILKVAMKRLDGINVADIIIAREAAGAVIEKIVESLPEYVKSDADTAIGWNAYHDTLKDILTEGKKA